MTIKNPVVNKVFNDLDAFRDYCRFEVKFLMKQTCIKRMLLYGRRIKNIKDGYVQRHVSKDVDNA